MSFSEVYNKVAGIVHKARKDYYVHTWEREDWDQEGMLILYQLLERIPELEWDDSRLYSYFKVKFRNHIKDVVRKQESQKRRFDRMGYEEIGSVSHKLSTGGLLNDEFILLRGMLGEYRSQLSASEQLDYDKLISGQRFPGRRQLLRDLQDYLSDFSPSGS